MLSIGLTGGIAAGKSLLSARFRELGAVVIDADLLAREVVAPGTPGLAAVVERFGLQILLPDGALDRPRLGSIVFADPAARESLNAIVHPLVRAAADSLKRDAGPGTIVVQDIPLLVESGQGVNFHLVVVVQAPKDERIARMVRDRGMSREDALARLAAQASDAERAAAADVLIPNDGSPKQAVAELDALWHGRLLPFAANLAAGKPSGRSAAGMAADQAAATHGGSAGSGRAGQRAQEARLVARNRQVSRIRHVAGELAASVDHAGAADAERIQLRPAPEADKQSVVEALAQAGFFPCRDAAEGENVLASADPAESATVEIVG